MGMWIYLSGELHLDNQLFTAVEQSFNSILTIFLWTWTKYGSLWLADHRKLTSELTVRQSYNSSKVEITVIHCYQR